MDDLFPSGVPGPLDESDEERGTEEERVRALYRKFRGESESSCRAHHSRGAANWRFASSTGSRWPERKKHQLIAEVDLDRARIDLNDIEPVIEAAASRESMNRFREVVESPTPDLDALAEVANAYNGAELEHAHAPYVDSDGFYDTLVQGIQAMWVRKEMMGRIPRTKITALPLSETYWDARARAKNLLDRRWGAWESRWNIKDVKKRWPDWKPKNSVGMSGIMPRTTIESAVIEHFPGGAKISNASRRAVCYFEWKDEETYYELELPRIEADPQTAAALGLGDMPVDQELAMRAVLIEQGYPSQGVEWREVDKEEAGAVVDFLELSGEDPAEYLVELTRDRFNYAWLVDEEVVESGVLPDGAFTILFLAAAPRKGGDEWTWESKVDQMRPAQMMANSGLTAFLQTFAVRGKGVMGYTPGTFMNEDSARVQFALTGGLIPLNDKDGIVEFPVPAMPPVDNLIGMFRDAVTQAGGEDRYTTGGAGDLRRLSSKTLSAATAAGSARLARFLDALSLYREERARLMIRQMYAYHKDEPGEVEQIIGPAKAALIPADVDQWRKAFEFRVIVKEQSLEATESGRAALREQLLNSGVLQQLAALGLPPLPMGFFVRLFGDLMSEEDKQEWRAAADAAQQAAAQQPPPEGGPQQQ